MGCLMHWRGIAKSTDPDKSEGMQPTELAPAHFLQPCIPCCLRREADYISCNLVHLAAASEEELGLQARQPVSRVESLTASEAELPADSARCLGAL